MFETLCFMQLQTIANNCQQLLDAVSGGIFSHSLFGLNQIWISFEWFKYIPFIPFIWERERKINGYEMASAIYLMDFSRSLFHWILEQTELIDGNTFQTAGIKTNSFDFAFIFGFASAFAFGFELHLSQCFIFDYWFDLIWLQLNLKVSWNIKVKEKIAIFLPSSVSDKDSKHLPLKVKIEQFSLAIMDCLMSIVHAHQLLRQFSLNGIYSLLSKFQSFSVSL